MSASRLDAEEILSSLLDGKADAVGDALFATDLDERIVFMSASASTLTAWRPEEALGLRLSEVCPLAYVENDTPIDTIKRALQKGFSKDLPRTCSLVTKTGKNVSVHESVSAIVDATGKVIGAIVILRDVTHRVRAERRTTFAERLTAMETMAAGMAHEINNPLAAAMANISFAMEHLERIPGASTTSQEMCDVRDALRDAIAAADRVKGIVHSLRNFLPTESKSELPDLDLRKVLDAAVDRTSRFLHARVAVRRTYGDVPLVAANEKQLVKVFVNLLMNAIHATGHAGAQRNDIDVVTSTDATGRAIVEVRDTGAGISKENLPHIFDPFFTTKSFGSGMGLGLSTVNSAIRAIDGDISVASEVGRGTTFRITLPAAPRRPPSSTRIEAVARRGTILIIDDDVAVARAVARILKPFHEVIVESDGPAGLARLGSGEPFDLVLCDLMMPTMSGIEIYERIASAHPELTKRIVFVSGGPSSARVDEFLAAHPNPHLRKPFPPEKLRAIAADYMREGAR